MVAPPEALSFLIAALVRVTQYKMGIFRLDGTGPLAENGGEKGEGGCGGRARRAWDGEMTLEGRLSPSLSVGNRSEAEASPLGMIWLPGQDSNLQPSG